MTRLVVVDVEELELLVESAVRRAIGTTSAAHEEWVDARTSGLGRRTFHRLANEGAFPVSKMGKKHVARRRDVNAYLERQRVQKAKADAAPLDPDPVARALAAGRLRVVKKPL